MPFDVRVTGLEELRGALHRLPYELAVTILPPAMRDLMAVVEQAIRERAPISADGTHGKPAGTLRRSVRSRIIEQTPASVRGTVGPRAPYAHLVEYGHAIVARGSGVRRKAGGIKRGTGTKIGSVPPHPFVRPALDASLPRALEVFNASVASRLDAAWASLAGQAKAA